MFYPDLEENSSRGIKSGAISKYQRNVGLYPAAFALLVNFINQIINYFSHCKLTIATVSFFEEERRRKDIVESGTGSSKKRKWSRSSKKKKLIK